MGPSPGAGAAEQPSDKYYKAAALADALARDVHYSVDEKQKAVLITDEGYEAAEDVLEVGRMRRPYFDVWGLSCQRLGNPH